MNSVVDLVKRFEEYLAITIGKDGFPNEPLFALHHDDTITMAVMAIPSEQIFKYAMQNFLTDLTIKELVFGIDQYTKPGQGTKYDDVLTVVSWVGERVGNFGFRIGVVNYRPPPNTVIEPIDWDNQYWNDVFGKIIEREHTRMMHAIDRIRKTDPDVVSKTELIVQVAAKRARGED